MRVTSSHCHIRSVSSPSCPQRRVLMHSCWQSGLTSNTSTSTCSNAAVLTLSGLRGQLVGFVLAAPSQISPPVTSPSHSRLHHQAIPCIFLVPHSRLHHPALYGHTIAPSRSTKLPLLFAPPIPFHRLWTMHHIAKPFQSNRCVELVGSSPRASRY
jgi:hypothetical protein